MKKKSLFYIVLAAVMILVSSCGQEEYTKRDGEFYDTFDTHIIFSAYTKSEDEFKNYFKIVKDDFTRLHKLYDLYNDYEGVNNIKTINDQAGIAPVEVDQEIIDLIKFSKEEAEKYSNKTNIAMGPVLKLWHETRTEGIKEPEKAVLPSMEALEEAKKHTDLSKVIIDEDKKTVYLEEKEMSLDLGATAKGYATQIVVDHLKKEGVDSAIISAGGNVEAIGKPLDSDREKWGIGLQNPIAVEDETAEKLFDVVFANNKAVVTSGDYQRYYTVDGQRYHHIIDPDTLMPGDYYRAVTVVADDSGTADFMSTTLFLLPMEEGKALAEKAGIDVLWYLKDNSTVSTPGMDQMLKNKGARATDND